MSPLRATLEALRWLTGVVLLWAVPRCRPGGTVAPGTTVVVPARNEARTLPVLLRSLAGEATAAPAELPVLVVDDHSTDATAAVATAAGGGGADRGGVAVRVLAAPELAFGANGKAAACAAGAEAAMAAGATTLVFLDADCRLEPGGLARLATEHRALDGLLSVQPFHVTERPYEALSAFFNVVAMMGVGTFAPWRPRPTGAFGPCLVTSAHDYRRAGGHAGIGAAVLDDVALARAYRRAGLDVHCVGGRDTVSFRMYGDGPAQLVEGWTKNFAAGAGSTGPVILLLVIAWISGCISATWSPFTRSLPFGFCVYVAYALQVGWMLRRLGRFPWLTWVLFPVPLVFFLGVFLRSLVLTLIVRRVTWKGRSLSTRGGGGEVRRP